MAAAGPSDTNTTEESGTGHETGTFTEGEVEGEGEPGYESDEKTVVVPRLPSVPQRPTLDGMDGPDMEDDNKRPSKERSVPPDSNRASNRITLWSLLAPETQKILSAAAPDRREDVQRSSLVPQYGNIAYKANQTNNKFPEQADSNYNGAKIKVYSSHPRIGRSSEYGFTHKFPFLDGPIVENSHLLTSIVLGATGSNPRILIAFEFLQPTYDIHVFSSKSSATTTYSSNVTISNILSNAFIIIHVDYSDNPDLKFITTLKQLCQTNKNYVHFYSITKRPNGRIIKRDDVNETVFLKDINNAHVARVVYTAVHYHCFKSE